MQAFELLHKSRSMSKPTLYTLGFATGLGRCIDIIQFYKTGLAAQVEAEGSSPMAEELDRLFDSLTTELQSYTSEVIELLTDFVKSDPKYAMGYGYTLDRMTSISETIQRKSKEVENATNADEG